MPRPRLFPLMVFTIVIAAGTLSGDFRPTSRLAWAFEGPFNTERAGNILYLAGDFDAVAPIGNLSPYLVELQTIGSATPNSHLPGATGPVDVVLADGAGGYFVGGAFPSIGGVAQAALAHIRPDGTVDPAFAPVFTPVGSTEASVSALARSGDVLYVGGHFSQINGMDRTGAAAMTLANGAVLTWDPGFPIGTEVSALVVSGTTAYMATDTVHAVDAVTGAPRPGFAATVNGVGAMAPGGSSLYLGGSFTTVNGGARRGLAAVDAATGALLPLTADLNTGGRVEALALDGTTLYVGGFFSSLGGHARGRLGAVDVASGAVTAFDPGVNGRVYALLVQGPTVYAAGEFSRVGGEPRANIAALSKAGIAQPWNPGLSSGVSSLTASGGVVVAGGFFTHFGAVPRDGLAAVDLVTGELTSFAPMIESADRGLVTIRGLNIAGHTLYVGGQFSSVNGLARQRLAALDVRTGTVLPWNPGPNGYVSSIKTVGAATYVAGLFTTIAGVARHSLAALDATTGADLGWNAGVTGQVSELEVGESTLYAAGNFSQLGGQPRSHVGAFDLGTRALTSFDPSVTGPGAFVAALRAVGNALYIGGRFSSVGGQPRTLAAAADRATGAVLPFAPVITGGGLVSDIDVVDGLAYLAGGFSTVNGEARSSDAAVDAATGLVTFPFDPAFGSSRGGSSHVRAEHDLLFSSTFAEDLPHIRSGLFPSTAMGGVPGRPSAPVPLVTGGTAIAMHWRPSPIGGEPASYVVEAGTTPGAANLGALPTSSPSFSFTGVPAGRYFLRVRALNAFGSSPASPEIAVVFGNVSCGTVPLPVTLGATVSGSTVTVTWPDAVGASGTYALAAGGGAGLSNIGTFGTGATRQIVTDAPAGVYYTRVLADSPCGQGAAGPDTVIAVGGLQPLPSPLASAQVSGDTVTITWAAVPGAASYRLEAGSGPLLANIVTTDTTLTSLAANTVPPGTYYVRVHALFGGGTAVSNELVVMVP